MRLSRRIGTILLMAVFFSFLNYYIWIRLLQVLQVVFSNSDLELDLLRFTLLHPSHSGLPLGKSMCPLSSLSLSLSLCANSKGDVRYHTGTLFLGYINGPTEGLKMLLGFYLVTYFVGKPSPSLHLPPSPSATARAWIKFLPPPTTKQHKRTSTVVDKSAWHLSCFA